jgi:CPA1 family monovalent cation:H+ antiporter
VGSGIGAGGHRRREDERGSRTGAEPTRSVPGIAIARQARRGSGAGSHRARVATTRAVVSRRDACAFAMTAILYTVAAILTVVGTVAWIASRLRLPPPILLVVAGIALELMPWVPAVELEPDVVLLVLLPPLIYFAAFSMSWQAFRANLRPILLLAFGCVIVTTAAVAVATNQLLGLPLAVAFMLGAIVSPPDVVAPLAIAERLSIPHRIIAVLEGEGLVNDATALILFDLALTAVLTSHFSIPLALRDFALVLVGETVWGLVVGYVVLRLRHFAAEPRLEVLLSLLTPFAAFWLPHALGGSGVLATVMSGLYVGSAGVALIRSNTRLQALFFWDVLNTVITGTIFLLTGLQARTVAEGLDAGTLSRLVADGVLVSAVVIAVRFLWVFPATYLPRLIPSIAARDPAPDWRVPFVIAFTGVRGVVSLAAALSVPLWIAPDVAFPERGRVLVLTFVVIVVTLVVQGLTLPWVLRRLHLDQWGRTELRERKGREIAARVEAARAALAALDAVASSKRLPDDVIAGWRKRELLRISQLEDEREEAGERVERSASMYRVELELVAAQRKRLNELLREGKVSDDIRRRIEHDLDLDEERLRGDLLGIANDDDEALRGG